jgi:hypothetical protein
MLTQENRFVRGESAARLKLSSHRPAHRRGLDAPARSAPGDWGASGDKSHHRIRHISRPILTPEFTVREDLQANLSLSREDLQDRGIFLFAELIARD